MQTLLKYLSISISLNTRYMRVYLSCICTFYLCFRTFCFCVTWLDRVPASSSFPEVSSFGQMVAASSASVQEEDVCVQRRNTISWFQVFLTGFNRRPVFLRSFLGSPPLPLSQFPALKPGSCAAAEALRCCWRRCPCSSRLWISSPGPARPEAPAGTTMTSSARWWSSASWSCGSGGWSQKVRRRNPSDRKWG